MTTNGFGPRLVSSKRGVRREDAHFLYLSIASSALLFLNLMYYCYSSSYYYLFFLSFSNNLYHYLFFYLLVCYYSFFASSGNNMYYTITNQHRVYLLPVRFYNYNSQWTMHRPESCRLARLSKRHGVTERQQWYNRQVKNSLLRFRASFFTCPLSFLHVLRMQRGTTN